MSDNKQLQLVTFPQAQRLKASGFDWWTSASYSIDSVYHAHAIPSGSEGSYIPAPSVALALKWLRDIRGLLCGIYITFFKNEYQTTINSSNNTPKFIRIFNDYELAESALLDAALDELEKARKQ